MSSMVTESRAGPRLALKAFQSLRGPGNAVGQELERYKTAELGVLGLVDHTHPAAAELFQDAVVRNGSAQHAVPPRTVSELGYLTGITAKLTVQGMKRHKATRKSR